MRCRAASIPTDGPGRPRSRPSHFGYSIGTWVDDNGDGRYDALEIETRGFKGPRTFEATGIPLADDNETVIKERIFIDKGDPDILHDVITVIDHALTRPWVVDKRYKRDHNPIWFQNNCSEDNRHVFIGNEHYVISGDDLLMPSKKNQAPPDLQIFQADAEVRRAAKSAVLMLFVGAAGMSAAAFVGYMSNRRHR